MPWDQHPEESVVAEDAWAGLCDIVRGVSMNKIQSLRYASSRWLCTFCSLDTTLLADSMCRCLPAGSMQPAFVSVQPGSLNSCR